MSLRINTQTARKFTRAALTFSVITSAVQGCVVLIVGFVGASYLKRTYDLSPTIVHSVAVILFIALVISTVRDVYLASSITSEMNKAGLDLDSAGSATVPANPNALLEFEQRMVDIARPFAWARAIAGVILGVIFVALTVFGLHRFGPPDSSNLPVYLFALMFVLVVLGASVSDVYSTWARFSIPLSEKRNVVVKPVELLLLVIWLSFFATFASLFAASGSPQLIATAAVAILIAAALMIKSYRATVSNTIVNPIDLAPIMIDDGEMVAVSVAGIMMIGAGILQKVGFGRRLPVQFFTPMSGRVLDPWAQNAFLVSESRVYFIYVPIGLADQAPEQVSMMESVFGGAHGRAKLDEMLGSMTLRQIYESNPINFAINLSDVGRVMVTRSIVRQVIDFFDRNGDKISVFVPASPELEAFEVFAQRRGMNLEIVDP